MRVRTSYKVPDRADEGPSFLPALPIALTNPNPVTTIFANADNQVRWMTNSMTTLALGQSRIFKVPQLVALSFRAQWIMFVIPALYLITNWSLLADVESYRIAPV